MFGYDNMDVFCLLQTAFMFYDLKLYCVFELLFIAINSIKKKKLTSALIDCVSSVARLAKINLTYMR